MTRSLTRYVGHAGGQAFRTLLHTNPLSFFVRAALVMLWLSAALTALVPPRLPVRWDAPPLAARSAVHLRARRRALRLGLDRGRDQHEPPPSRGGAVPHEAGSSTTGGDSGAAAVRARATSARRRAAPRIRWSAALVTTGLRKSVIAAVYPLASGPRSSTPPWCRAMAADERGRRDQLAAHVPAAALPRAGARHLLAGATPPDASFMLDWHDPRTWRRAVRRVARVRVGRGGPAVASPGHGAAVPVYPQARPKAIARVVICHNVVPHERVPGLRGSRKRAAACGPARHPCAAPTRGARALGLASTPVLEAFHPRFVAPELAPEPTEARERGRACSAGQPGPPPSDASGRFVPYKGIDLALDALGLVDPTSTCGWSSPGGSGSGGKNCARRRGARAQRPGRVP